MGTNLFQELEARFGLRAARQALSHAAAGGSSQGHGAGTLHAGVFRGIGTGTGGFNGEQRTLYNNIISGAITGSDLDAIRYVTAPRAQMVDAAVRTPELALWAQVKDAYATRSTNGIRPYRLLPVRMNAFQWSNTGVNIFNDSNSVGPVWDLGTYSTHTGERLTLPSTADVDEPYSEKNDPDNELSFAEAKAILDAAGFTWANTGLNPLGDTFPREFAHLGSRQYRLYDTVMRMNSTNWHNRLADFIVACLNDEDALGELDGVVVTLPKAWQYFTPYYGTPGVKSDGSRVGTATSKLRYWCKHRAEGADPDPDPGAWAVTTNTPVFASGSHIFDDPYHTTSYEFIEGWINFLTTLRSKIPSTKTIWADPCLHNDTVGFWSYAAGGSAFRQGWRSDYITANGGTQQAAQTAMLGKMEEAAAQCDGLIWPPSANTIEDPAQSGVTLEPDGWWESVRDSVTMVQYASA